MKVLGFFKKLWVLVTNPALKEKFLQIDNMVLDALPIVESVMQCFPDKTRTLAQLEQAFVRYNVQVTDWIKALPSDGSYGPALLHLATTVMSRTAPQIPIHQIQAAILLALAYKKK